MDPASSSVPSGGSGQSNENDCSVLKILLHGVDATLFSQSIKFELMGIMLFDYYTKQNSRNCDELELLNMLANSLLVAHSIHPFRIV